MINLRVDVTRGAHLFPDKTTSYDLSAWAPVSGFKQAWETKDATQVGVDPESAIKGVCVLGLCIRSTYDVLSDALNR